MQVLRLENAVGIPLAIVFVLSIIPYMDREKEDVGQWFGSPKGVRITFISAIYAMVCCTSMLVLVVGLDWPGAWPRGIGQLVIHFINPGTLLALMVSGWSSTVRGMISFEYFALAMSSIISISLCNESKEGSTFATICFSNKIGNIDKQGFPRY